MDNLQRWDELNNLQSKVTTESRQETNRKVAEEFDTLLLMLETEVMSQVEDTRTESGFDAVMTADIIEDALVSAYVFGNKSVNKMLGTDTPIPEDRIAETIFKKFDNKDFKERIREYAPKGDSAAIRKLIDTEILRDFNAGAYFSALDSKAKNKTWVTMRDEKVRDSHRYLDSMTIPVDAYFYTDTGDSALRPGGFDTPEQNINCRCFLIYD